MLQHEPQHLQPSDDFPPQELQGVGHAGGPAILWLGNNLSLYLGSDEQMRLWNAGQIDPLYFMLVKRK